jgi:hypothetical protein
MDSDVHHDLVDKTLEEDKMTRIIVAGSPYCPLCGNRMREIITPKGTNYVCLEEWCMISIHKGDPLINKWADMEKPLCQFCHKPMKLFVRMDRFIKLQCRDKSHRFYQIMKGDASDLPPLK